MNKKKLKPEIKLECLVDKYVLPNGKDCMRILEIGITAPDLTQETEKPPLNLALVLDRSGSMHGEKLHFAKQAAAHLVDQLGSNDRLAVVMYDEEVDVVSPSLQMTGDNKARLKSDIQRIASRGSTYLFGGWLKGCELVAEQDGNKGINRTLLLSDGLANVGLTNLDELATHARQLYQRSIATSCFGIGQDYDEHLLEAMSNAGGGNFHYLEAMTAIPLALERELEELVNISLQDVTLTLDLPDGVTCQVSAGWPANQAGQAFSVSIGSLVAGRDQKLYFQLHFKSPADETPLDLPVRVQALSQEGGPLQAVQALFFKSVPEEEEKKVTQDQPLMERFALVDMADRATEALRMARAGDRDSAQNMLYQTVSRHALNMSESNMRKYSNLSAEIKEGMDEFGFKRRHQEEYEHKRTRGNLRDYALRLVNGHLFARIEGQQVLVDTGIPVSLGPKPEWYFNHEVHTLSQGYLGVTTDQLSRLVGAPVDILIGCDILKKQVVTLDLPGGRITFSAQPILRSPHRFPLSDFMGVPILQLEAAGNPISMYVDTGARLSYISKDLANGMIAVGTEMDFYPGLGEFETPVYEVPFRLGELEFTQRCGVLPAMLEMAMQATGAKGILGTGLYQKYVVQLAFPESTISLRE